LKISSCPIRINSFRACVLIICFSLGNVAFSYGQEKSIPPQNSAQQTGNNEGNFRIRVGVEEVRLDVVVLDKKGRQVTDLTAEDFEIRQDGRRQKITSCIYINEYRPGAEVSKGSEKESGALPKIPAPLPEREDIQRMIAFVVDDLSMSFEQVHFARTALKRFVEKQMQPGDVVAIVKTAQGSAAYQLFSHDKQYLLRAIDKIRWYLNPSFIEYAATEYMAIDYFIDAMQDMPGRKALIVMTPRIKQNRGLALNIQDWKPSSVPVRNMDTALNLLADRALRAGVVVHTMDIAGVQPPDSIDVTYSGEYNPDEDIPLEPGDVSDSLKWDQSLLSSVIKNNMPASLISQKTGGLTVLGTNWFFRGLGPVHEALKGYYILTYIPPGNTFRYGRWSVPYHRISVKVKRPGLEVYSRDGFFGTERSVDPSDERPPTVRDAIYSPFRNNDLGVNLASGYVDDPEKGYMMRHHMHLEGKDLSIVEGKNGTHYIYADVVCRTYNMNDFVQDPGNLKYEFIIKDENIPWIREYGLRFSLDLPVEKPGAYYVRTAVMDQINGKAGSAYQYIEIPNLKKKRLSLSNIFIINREEDAPWSPPQTPEESRNLLYPDMSRDPRKSPALRIFLPGESFDYGISVYNAKNSKKENPSLQSWSVLYGNGREMYKSESESVSLNGLTDFERIPIRKNLYLGASVQPGDYILTLQVKDELAKEKQSLAVQALDFKVQAAVDIPDPEKNEIEEREEIILPDEILEQYVGTYRISPESNATVTLEEGRLYAQITGEHKLPLYPESETVFFHKAVAGNENEFLENNTGVVTHMIVRRGERELRALRISGSVIERKEISLQPEVLEQYVGVYDLGRGQRILISLENGHLYSRIPGEPMLRLCPETETKFFYEAVANAENEFIENDKGEVTHMIVRRDRDERKIRRISKKLR
jgi:VWFA-related protein